MDIILDQIFLAIKYLIIASLVIFSYRIAYKNTNKVNFKKNFWKGFLWCAGIALIGAYTLGGFEVNCIEYEYDQYGRYCIEYTENANYYNSELESRIAKFIFIMILIYIPVTIGVFKGRWNKVENDEC